MHQDTLHYGMEVIVEIVVTLYIAPQMSELQIYFFGI